MDLQDIQEETNVYVDAFSLLGKPVQVKVTHGKLLTYVQGVKDLEKEALVDKSNQIFRTLIDVDVDKLLKAVNENDLNALEQWDVFCSDILLLHACRFVLYGKPIPISNNIGKDMPSIGKPATSKKQKMKRRVVAALESLDIWGVIFDHLVDDNSPKSIVNMRLVNRMFKSEIDNRTEIMLYAPVNVFFGQLKLDMYKDGITTRTYSDIYTKVYRKCCMSERNALSLYDSVVQFMVEIDSTSWYSKLICNLFRYVDRVLESRKALSHPLRDALGIV